MKYYEINETTAEQAKRSYSFKDYEQGQATNNYRAQVDNMRNIVADKVTQFNLNEERSLYLNNMLATYEKKLSEYINEENRITASCPSIMIVGGGNFNTKKKDNQNKAFDKLYNDKYNALNALEDKIKNYQPSRVGQEYINGGHNYNIEIDNDKYANAYFEVVNNIDLNRIQLIFNEKPTVEQIQLLKKCAFRYAPSQKAWQRQSTPNALIALEKLIKSLQ